MTVPPDAKLEHGVHARVYDETVAITDGDIEEINRLDYGYRERDEKKEEGGDEGGEDGKQSG